ncbi:hypothetical protein [uncultured Croceitalea sp.]|uniref:hypothetical protein n=1 Tax=uncultured Croceitalea sp. TaxID=1798908 RepID=UPI00330651FE
MRTILTFTAILFFSTSTFAQQSAKVDTVVKEVVLVQSVQVEKSSNEATEVARLYMFKNSRVKKALAFKTKRNRAKLA